jgi:inhibitor of KinA sporulation pathway (predicted exonuclease)
VLTGSASPPNSIVIFDTEYWTAEGAQERNWNGLDDAPPLLVQIAALSVKAAKTLPVTGEFMCYVIPRNESGEEIPLTDYFVNLTGISREIIREQGLELPEALCRFAAFVDGRSMYSFGHDVRMTFLPSCFLARITCPFDPEQAKDIRQVLRRSMTDEEIMKCSSGTIAERLGIKLEGHLHDAHHDARSLLEALRFLLSHKRMDPSWLL